MIFTSQVFAQKTPATVEVTDINENSRPGIKVTIPNTNVAEVTAHWKKYLKSLKGKTQVQKEGYFTDNAILPQLSNNPVNIFSEIESYPAGVVLKTFFDMGGVFLNNATYADKYPLAVTLLRDFAAHESSIALQNQLTLEEKKLYRLSEERKTLKKENKTAEVRLNALKEQLKEAELSLSENKAAMEKTDAATKAQINRIEQLKKQIESTLLPQK